MRADTELVSYGFSGTPVLLFPSEPGKRLEWEEYGIEDVFHRQLSSGEVQFYCLEGINDQSWFDAKKHPYERGLIQESYDSYLCYEVMPFIDRRSQHSKIVVLGCKHGALQAASLALRYPKKVKRLIAIAGFFHLRYLDSVIGREGWPRGYSDNMVTMFDPYEIAARLPSNEEAPEVYLATSEGDEGWGRTSEFHEWLDRFSIGNKVNYWNGETDDPKKWLEAFKESLS